MKFAVGTLLSFLPKGPFITHPKIVHVAKGPPSLLRRPTSDSILCNLIPFKCGQRFTSSCVPTVSGETGRLGVEYTIGSSIRFCSLRSDTSRFTKEHSIDWLDYAWLLERERRFLPFSAQFSQEVFRTE